ncbi:peptidylprolyl isomerase [Candidatus Woesearchaeota archaeon]|nr:peptidylprolyl isomerase [Candidatus Woesearchaeota archaeon]
MPIKKNDFVELEYTGRLKDSNEVFDTTDEKTAKESKIHAKNAIYQPIVICVGEGHLLKGLDEFLVGKDAGKFSVEIKADHAFGKKDASMLKMLPTNKFAEQGIKPVPGLRLNIDGYVGIIKSVSGGRTVVDFNHPLAGHDVIYELKVNKVVTDKKVQVESILKVLLGIRTKVEVAGNKAKVDIPKLPAEILAELSKKVKELTGCDVDYILHEPESKKADDHHDHAGHDHSDPNHKH